MAIEYKKNLATLSDAISIEDAENLLQWIQQTPKGKVNLSACSHMHAAILQVLMAARTPVVAWPNDSNLAIWLRAALGF